MTALHVFLLREPEPLRPLLDGDEELLLQQLLGLVHGQVQLVEASVRRGQLARVAVRLVDREALHSTHTLQVREPSERNLQHKN